MRAWILLISLLVILSACAPGVQQAAPSAPTQGQHECTYAWDCPAGKACPYDQPSWRQCLTVACETHADCPQRTLCNPDTKVCTYEPCGDDNCQRFTRCGTETDPDDPKQWQRASCAQTRDHKYCVIEEATCGVQCCVNVPKNYAVSCGACA